jgi:hypothetical protein
VVLTRRFFCTPPMSDRGPSPRVSVSERLPRRGRRNGAAQKARRCAARIIPVNSARASTRRPLPLDDFVRDSDEGFSQRWPDSSKRLSHDLAPQLLEPLL